MTQPLVSVVIPAFNRAAVLPDALESIFAQGMADVQVILVDDGSTDDTRRLAAEWRNRVTYIHQENAGAAAARNRGLESARGRYISFLDSDDVWLPGKLELELSLLESLPDVDAVITDAEFWELGAVFVPSRFAEREIPLPPGEATVFSPGDPALPWERGSLFATCCLTLRSSCLARLGPRPFDERFRWIEDWEFEIRLYHLCRIAFHPRILARVRRFEDGTRPDAPPLGQQPTPGQRLRALQRERRMFERVLDLPRLHPDKELVVRQTLGRIGEEIRTLEDADAAHGM